MADPTVLRPIFIATDPATVQQDCLTLFETTEGKTLEPAQVERLLVNALAYRESLTRMGVQLAGEQNLVAFASGSNLDALAALFALTRFTAVAATCTVRFTLSATSGADTAIPVNTRVKTRDGQFVFATSVASKIAAGALFADVTCACQQPGTAANGYAAGDVNNLMDPIAGVATAVNQDATSGGIDVETDDAFRARVQLAPYRMGTAGSLGGYKFWAMSAGAWVVDANVTSPTPGNVQVAILANTGTPTSPQLAAVAAVLTGDTVRPITDTVTVVAANRITYTISASLTIYTGGDATSILAAATLAVQTLAANRRAKLGRDVTPGQVSAALLSVPGIYDLTLTQPAAPVVAGDADWCDCTSITLSVAGSANG